MIFLRFSHDFSMIFSDLESRGHEKTGGLRRASGSSGRERSFRRRSQEWNRGADINPSIHVFCPPLPNERSLLMNNRFFPAVRSEAFHG